MRDGGGGGCTFITYMNRVSVSVSVNPFATVPCLFVFSSSFLLLGFRSGPQHRVSSDLNGSGSGSSGSKGIPAGRVAYETPGIR